MDSSTSKLWIFSSEEEEEEKNTFPKPLVLTEKIEPKRVYIPTLDEIISEMKAHITYRTDGILSRRKMMQDQIAFDRRRKKDAIMRMNRGFPVNSKDAFDLRDLKESLPSTSAVKPDVPVIICRRRGQSMLAEYAIQMRQRCHSEQGFISSHPPKLSRIMMDRFGRAPNPRICTPFINLEEKLNLLQRSRKFVELEFQKMEETGADREQKETRGNTVNFDEAEKTLQNWACQGQKKDAENSNASEFDPLTVACTKVAEMSLDEEQEEKKEEKQNYDDVNNPESIGFHPMPNLKDLGECSNWGSGRSWDTDFQFPQTSVPLNSPNKNDGIVAESERIISLAEGVLKGVRQMNMMIRKQSRIRSLNSNRDGLIEGVTECEQSEKIVHGALNNLRNLLNASKKKDEEFTNKSPNFRQKLSCSIKESVKNYRSFRNERNLSIHALKSDKVLPD